ncbi:MAG: hypothetical protein M3Q07_11130 [Pseudobdellovibrionaceae bacterium]|nr:hypothetical protein [Pseudobdellovibrionaceae bacterium]
MVSQEQIRSRIISYIAQKGGKASKPDIIRNTKGAKLRLIRTIDQLVDKGMILKEGDGTKGSPHTFILVEAYRVNASEINNCIITVTI